MNGEWLGIQFNNISEQHLHAEPEPKSSTELIHTSDYFIIYAYILKVISQCFGFFWLCRLSGFCFVRLFLQESVRDQRGRQESPYILRWLRMKSQSLIGQDIGCSLKLHPSFPHFSLILRLHPVHRRWMIDRETTEGQKRRGATTLQKWDVISSSPSCLFLIKHVMSPL